MSTYVISDIHGCNEKFRRALKLVGLNKTDTLVLLGDLIDRGSGSKEVLDTVFLLEDYGFNIISLKGNHEDMLLKARENPIHESNWLRNGGNQTLESFSTSDIDRIPSNYINYLSQMPLYLEIGKFILVHAAIDMTAPDPFRDEQTMLWGRNWEKLYDSNWLGNRIIIHGHTPMPRNEIVSQLESERNIICIDNGSFRNDEGFGEVCVLKLDDLSIKFT